MKRMLKFTVAEPADVIQEGVTTVLQQINAGFRVFQVRDMAQLPGHLHKERPDVLVVNPALPGVVPPQKLREMLDRPDLICVGLVTGGRDMAYLQGFDEHISLFDDFEKIREKMARLVSRGSKEDSSTEKALSQREKEIITYVVKGFTNKQMADKLCLSQHTVMTHRRNIAAKLQIHSPAGLTIYAIANKLVRLEELDG